MLQNPSLRPSNGQTVRLPPNSAPMLFPAIEDFFNGIYFPPLGDPATREAYLPGTNRGYDQTAEALHSAFCEFVISIYDQRSSFSAGSIH